MKTLSPPRVSQSPFAAHAPALLATLGKLGIALLAALLLGLALDYVPTTTTNWTLPFDAASAAVFTA